MNKEKKYKLQNTGFLLSKLIFLINILVNILFVHLIINATAIIVICSTVLVVLFITFCDFLKKIHTDILTNENKNKLLMKELEEKDKQLESVKEELKVLFEKSEDMNIKFQEVSKKLNVSVAEFYTVQQIAKAVSSILDAKELIKHVNDIILGVMGGSGASILFYEEKKMVLKVGTTSLYNKSEVIILNDNINCGKLLEVLKSNHPVIDNHVKDEDYPFTKDRGIKSIICVPLSTKSKKLGLVIVEHTFENAFNEYNVRLLDIIGQQVSIAMENAELYQIMQELATTDNLTGVYNRVYFNKKIKEEFELAKSNNYEFSLAIFDIDHFKKFNDTYGHLFGDKVLKHIAELVKNSVTNTDIVARFGGEEFIILFPKTNLETAFNKVEEIRKKIGSSIISDELITANVTVSFGVSNFPSCCDYENALIKTADNALYEAKENGRNKVCKAALK